MKITQKMVVLSTQRYSMTNTETGEIVRGTSVRYVLSEDLAPVNENGFRGLKVAKCSIPYDDYDKVTVVPGLYGAEFDVNIGADGKPVLKPNNFKIISDVRIAAGSDKTDKDVAKIVKN